MTWIAGKIAFKYKNDTSLADHSSSFDVLEEKEVKSLFLTKSLEQSIILKPSKDFLEDVRKLDFYFNNYHPKDEKLRKGEFGLIKNFSMLMLPKFPHLKFEILNEFTQLKSEIHLKHWNKKIQENKKARSTRRGLAKNAEFFGSTK